MAKTFFYLLKEIRPRQWIKNLTIFAAIFFTGKLLDPTLLGTTIIAFVAFCCTSSSLYLLNDIVDIEKDKLHPFKRHRPLASGKISQRLAIVALVALTLLAVYFATLVSLNFLLLILAFYLLQITYSFVLKNLMLFDILAIAAGFILRVFAGEVATGYHINIWLVLTVVSVSLFLAIGKRRSELTLLAGWAGSVPAKTRSTLMHYSEKMLDVYISMFANSAWITYAFYTFLERPPVLRSSIFKIIEDNDLANLSERKLLTLTIPIVIYGIMRYLQLIYEKNEGESPEKILLTDKPLIVTGLALGAMIFTIIYVIGK